MNTRFLYRKSYKEIIISLFRRFQVKGFHYICFGVTYVWLNSFWNHELGFVAWWRRWRKMGDRGYGWYGSQLLESDDSGQEIIFTLWMEKIHSFIKIIFILYQIVWYIIVPQINLNSNFYQILYKEKFSIPIIPMLKL